MRLALAVVFALAWPALARACAVCGTATERNRGAFLAMTIFMSLLPLGMFAAGGLWFRRRQRQAEDVDRFEDAPQPPVPVAGTTSGEGVGRRALP